jgi:hypothetical protein
MIPVALITLAAGLFAAAILCGIHAVNLRRNAPREPSDKEPASPVPATPRARWWLPLRLVPPWRRTREYEGAGDGIEYSRLLHSLVIERDLDPQAPIDPDEQRWAQEFAEVRAHLGEAVEACARGIYRAQLKADKDALTVTGSWNAAGRAELDAMLAESAVAP